MFKIQRHPTRRGFPAYEYSRGFETTLLYVNDELKINDEL